MRKIFAIVLVALLLGVGVVALIETDPGYVLVAYGNYTMETSLWVGLLLLLLLTFLIYALLRLVYRLVSGQRSLVNWFGTRQARHASRLTTRGLISFSEGDWARARRQLERGAKHNDAPLINHLVAARSSYRLHEPEKITEHLDAARDAESGAALAVDLTRAEMHLLAGQHEEATVLLEQARKSGGKHPHVLGMLREAYSGQRDWDKLAGLLPELKKHKVLPEEDLQSLERQVHGHLLAQSTSGAQGEALDNLHRCWQQVPGGLKQDSAMLQGYVTKLIEQGADTEAEKAIKRGLKHKWSSELVRQYGYVETDNIPRQLAQAESWLADHTDDAQLLLCLGRLSARDKLWGKARDYFESSYRLERSAETCAELGRLLLGLGEPRVAAAYYREGLQLLETGLPELPMPEKLVSPGRQLAHS